MMTQSSPNALQLMPEDELSLALIEAQYALIEQQDTRLGKGLLVLVNGIELAGKGEAVKQLREWVDPRYLQVKAETAQLLSCRQPFWQPYSPFIPAAGQIQIMFGNWYSDLLATALHVTEPLSQSRFDRYIEQMRTFEQDLRHNQVEVVKVWFDLSWDELQRRLDHLTPAEQAWQRQHGLDWRDRAEYDTVQQLRQRFSADWRVIDGADKQARDQQFAQHILQAMPSVPANAAEPACSDWTQADIPAVLLNPQTRELPEADYKQQLKVLSQQVAQALRVDKRRVVIVFEGMDAAGKGGAIKRIIKKLDPREYQIHSIGAPERYELRQPYLWRFWTRLSDQPALSIFDRSWYGRVLVERVEALAQPQEWQRAYAEINRFEQDLSNSQTCVIKFWLAISQEEQAQRFKARCDTPHKRFKITDEDWRNRHKWDDYLEAAADLLAQTSTPWAPWQVIASDDKHSARIQILEGILKQLKAE